VGALSFDHQCVSQRHVVIHSRRLCIHTVRDFTHRTQGFGADIMEEFGITTTKAVIDLVCSSSRTLEYLHLYSEAGTIAPTLYRKVDRKRHGGTFP
jgi:hypothetical protein